MAWSSWDYWTMMLRSWAYAESLDEKESEFSSNWKNKKKKSNVKFYRNYASDKISFGLQILHLHVSSAIIWNMRMYGLVEKQFFLFFFSKNTEKQDLSKKQVFYFF